MLETLKKWRMDLTLKVKDLFTSPESQVYVKDLRQVMTYNEKKCQYPKNYDQIVEFGKIIEGQNSDGKTIYMLLYGPKDKDREQPSFKLTIVKEAGDRSYFAVDYRDNQGKQIPIDWLDKSYFEPLGFSRLDLRKRVPAFEAQKTGDSKYPFKLTNSSILTTKEKSKEGKIQEVIDLKGRNGQLLYTSDYKRLSTSFAGIRDQNDYLELDKSLISIPIALAAGSAKICAKLLTFIPIKLGEHLINRQNPIVKFFGYLLFTPAMAVKNLVNMGTTVLKAPILLFVADKKKYGDFYWTMWKHQLKEYWKETKNDYSVIKEGKRSEPEEKDYPELGIVGTWKELGALPDSKYSRLLYRNRINPIMDLVRNKDKVNARNEFSRYLEGELLPAIMQIEGLPMTEYSVKSFKEKFDVNKLSAESWRKFFDETRRKLEARSGDIQKKVRSLDKIQLGKLMQDPQIQATMKEEVARELDSQIEGFR